MNHVRLMLLTVFGLGLLKPAPGTWGSTPPILLAFVLTLTVDSPDTITVVLAVSGTAFSTFSVIFGRWAEQYFDRKDASQVVADEIGGQALVLLFVPWHLGPDVNYGYNIAICISAFVLFRFFDILKVPPANSLQTLPRGWGVMIDDIVAGVYAMIGVQALARIVLPALAG